MDDKELLRDDLRMDAYYYAFSETGQILVDRMLSSVALAGKAYHHTEFWSDDAEPWRSWQRGSSHVEFIQNAANDVATRLTALAEENERLKAALRSLQGGHGFDCMYTGDSCCTCGALRRNSVIEAALSEVPR